MKVIIVSYGHPDSGLTLAKHLSSRTDLTFLLVVSGDRFERGILNLDLSRTPYGLIKDKNIINSLFPKEIVSYMGDSFKPLLLHTPTLKILKDWKRQNLRFCLHAARYIQENKFDVVHFNGISGFQIYFHFFLRDKSKVWTIHDYIPHSGEENPATGFTRPLISKFNYQFIQHSEKLKEGFIKYYKVNPENVHAIYYGPLDISNVFKNEETKEGSSSVLFWGRISKYKGIKYLLDAGEIIKKKCPDVKITIAGKGKLDINKDKIDKSIFEINNNYINNYDIVQYIQKSNIIVLPYTDATQSAVLMTAYAFNKPVVATNVGGIPEVVEDGVTGLLVPPRNPEKLAEAIIGLLENPEKRKTMSENIKKKFNEGKFSWDSIAQRTIEVYQKAIRE